MASIAKPLVFFLLTQTCFINAVFGQNEIYIATDALAPTQAPTQHHSLAPSHHHHHHPHHHHNVHSPVYSPTPSPSKAPVHPPVQSPAKSPVHSPAKAPASPPTQSPVQPPVHPSSHLNRSFVAVQGVVYCKSCKYGGADTLLGATPLSGATVRLMCNNTKHTLSADTKSDRNGYFVLTAPKNLTSFAFHKCKMSLVNSVVANCTKPSQLNGGLDGAILRPFKPVEINKLKYVLYSVGPFAFEPKC